MKEKLIIKNFGPIKSIDLDLGKITVLIGEQASGKSTVAKVLAICRYFSYIIDDLSLIVNEKSSFERNAFKDWGLEDYATSKTYIYYENKDYSVEIKYIEEILYYINAENDEEEEVKQSIQLLSPNLKPISEQFKNLLETFESLKPKREYQYAISKDWSIPHSFLMTDVKSVMNNPFYFPTERGLQSIFSLGKSSIQNLSDSLFNQFAKLDQIAKNFKSEIEIEPLNLTYKNQNGEGYFKVNGQSEFYKLSQGASGFQTSIPIILGIKYYNLVEKRGKTFIVEEPEINLFPKTQKKMLDYFVSSINNFGNSFLIPTHSPYFLSALNDLIIAYKRGQSNPKETQKIIPKESWLNPKDLNIYELKDGSAENIVDMDTGLISDNIIDEVSDDLSDEFNELLEIK